MADFDPFDPFSHSRKQEPNTRRSPLDALLPPAEQPSPSLLAKILAGGEQPSLSPEQLKAIETMLTTQKTASPPAPPPCVTKRLRAHVTLGFSLIDDKKLEKQNSVVWISRLKSLLEPVLGDDTYTRHLDAIRKQIVRSGVAIEAFATEVGRANDFVESLEQEASSAAATPVSRFSRVPNSKDVFIIHGKDELNWRRLTEYLRQDEGLNPVVMMAGAGISRALSDKFEEEASKCAFAFALFTADDVVHSKSNQYYQARPNVIYETGWFVGRLGKARVRLLLEEGVEMHTDLQGISRIQFSGDVMEKYHDIRRELKVAGLVR